MATGATLSMRDVSNEDVKPTFQLPDITPPFPVKLNPHREAATTRLQQYLEKKNVASIFSPKMYKMLLDMDIAGLAARVYPDAGEWGLDFACRFLAALWVLDDTFDSTDVGKSVNTAISRLLEIQLVIMWCFPDDPVLLRGLETFLDALNVEEREHQRSYVDSVLAQARISRTTVYPHDVSLACIMYRELWDDAIKKMQPEFCLRLAHSTQRWLSGVLAEIRTRISTKKSIPPSIDDYIQNRRRTSAVEVCMVVVDLIYDIHSPNEWFYGDEMQNLTEALNDFISWHNDIWSFKREVLVRGDVINLVLVISVYQKVAHAQALEIATTMIKDKIVHLEQALMVLEHVTPPELKKNLVSYMHATKNWVAGTHDWHSHSVRYM